MKFYLAIAFFGAGLSIFLANIIMNGWTSYAQTSALFADNFEDGNANRHDTYTLTPSSNILGIVRSQSGAAR